MSPPQASLRAQLLQELRAVEAVDAGLPARKQAERHNLCWRGQAALLQPLEQVGPTHHEDHNKGGQYQSVQEGKR